MAWRLSPLWLLPVAAVMFVLGQYAPSRDLLALWLAASNVAAGQPGDLFPPVTDLFLMRPPMHWFDLTTAIGHPGEAYPYIYPPIWAWLLAPLTKFASFQVFKSLVFVANALMIAGIVLIAARMSGATGGTRRLPPLQWLAIVAFMLFTSQAAVVALKQNQMQILVAFLCLFALDRADRDRPFAAGLALGVAIALKLSPLPLALIWLLIGRWRALLVATATGGALGLASLGVAGWPIHAEFLAVLDMIDRTILITTQNFTLDTVAAGFLGVLDGQLVSSMPPEITDPAIAAAFEDPDALWAVLAKPALVGWLSKAGMLATVLGIAALLRRTPAGRGRAALWAAALTGLAFFAPIGWTYYYLAPFAFAPLLWLQFGRAGLVGLLTGTILMVPAFSHVVRTALGTDAGQFLGLIVPAYMIALIVVARRNPSAQAPASAA